MAFAVATSLGALVAFIGRKTTVVTATITGFVALTAAFIACINYILTTVLALINIPAWIAMFVGMFIPASFGPTLAAIISAKTCRAAYDLAMEKIRAINSAN